MNLPVVQKWLLLHYVNSGETWQVNIKLAMEWQRGRGSLAFVTVQNAELTNFPDAGLFCIIIQGTSKEH